MTSGAVVGESADPQKPSTVRVWDLFVRVFHWSLVAFIAVAMMTGEEAEQLHVQVGYWILFLVGARVIGGFIGTKYARFSNFVRPPSEVVTFVMQSLSLRAPRVLGHNPAGGAMIVVLLVMIGVVSATGVMLTSDAGWGSEAVEGIHEATAYLLLALVLMHVAGVVLTSFEHGENLVRAMWTGQKRA
jgi:cytochrome b